MKDPTPHSTTFQKTPPFGATAYEWQPPFYELESSSGASAASSYSVPDVPIELNNMDDLEQPLQTTQNYICKLHRPLTIGVILILLQFVVATFTGLVNFSKPDPDNSTLSFPLLQFKTHSFDTNANLSSTLDAVSQIATVLMFRTNDPVSTQLCRPLSDVQKEIQKDIRYSLGRLFNTTAVYSVNEDGYCKLTASATQCVRLFSALDLPRVLFAELERYMPKGNFMLTYVDNLEQGAMIPNYYHSTRRIKPAEEASPSAWRHFHSGWKGGRNQTLGATDGVSLLWGTLIFTIGVGIWVKVRSEEVTFEYMRLFTFIASWTSLSAALLLLSGIAYSKMSIDGFLHVQSDLGAALISEYTQRVTGSIINWILAATQLLIFVGFAVLWRLLPQK